MTPRPKCNRITGIARICLVLTLIFAASCEDLTDGLSSRDKIATTWKCLEKNSSNVTDNFLIEIESESSSLNGIKIYNFDNLGTTFYISATVTGLIISIPSQTADGFKISGSGTIDSDYKSISLSYTVEDEGGDKENYTATCTLP